MINGHGWEIRQVKEHPKRVESFSSSSFHFLWFPDNQLGEEDDLQRGI